MKYSPQKEHVDTSPESESRCIQQELKLECPNGYQPFPLINSDQFTTRAVPDYLPVSVKKKILKTE